VHIGVARAVNPARAHVRRAQIRNGRDKPAGALTAPSDPIPAQSAASAADTSAAPAQFAGVNAVNKLRPGKAQAEIIKRCARTYANGQRDVRPPRDSGCRSARAWRRAEQASPGSHTRAWWCARGLNSKLLSWDRIGYVLSLSLISDAIMIVGSRALQHAAW